MRLAVREWGTGSRRALLIHGATAGKEAMAPLAEALADRGYRVIAPDLRGHGQSPRGGPYTLQALADDLVDTLGGPVELAAGHSLGGKILPWAIPDLQVRRALYLDPAWTASASDPYAAALTKPDGAPMNLDDLSALYPTRSPADQQEALAAYLAMDWRLFHDRRLQLRRTTVPPIPAQTRSLVVLADPSTLVPPVLAQALTVGNYEIRTQKGAGHGLFQQDLPGFLATVEDWL